MELAEDFAGVNWKELYLQKSFHHRMTSFTAYLSSPSLPSSRSHPTISGYNDEDEQSNVEQLVAFHSRISSHLRTLQITPAFAQLSALEPLYFIARSPQLEYANLSDHVVDQALMGKLVHVLTQGKLSKLKSLKLSGCDINDAVAALLFAALPQTKIERLDLSENKLTDASLRKIAELLASPQCRLQQISYDLSSSLPLHLSSPHLPISVRSNKIRSEHGAYDSLDTGRAESEQTMNRLFVALAANQSLRLLDISHNALNFVKVPLATFTAVAENQTLRYLLINDNRLVWDEASSDSFVHFLENLPKVPHHLLHPSPQP